MLDFRQTLDIKLIFLLIGGGNRAIGVSIGETISLGILLPLDVRHRVIRLIIEKVIEG